ncbi:unnamed protein product [Durusdinium trenchii]|uniref:FMN hydroxy acid dehydrogenase domain-containing protein n=1 Tax=Durusdinium trenchii TaxID=1381693 RepID=A0ABP0S372_9DINO
MPDATNAGAPPMDALATAEQLEEAAEKRISEGSWDYIMGGEADTICRNRTAFDPWLFRPRILRDVSEIDLSCSLFGAACATPIYLSSVAKGRLVDPKGEATFVRAAERLRSRFLVPTVSSLPLEEIWKASKHSQAFQIYLLTNDENFAMPAGLAEALRLGVNALVLTVDANAPRHGALHRFTSAGTGVFPSPLLDWEKFKEMRKSFPVGVPVYLKGVQCAEDALMAVELGLQGVVVSNHGGRACGNSIGALEALQEISAALREAGHLGPNSTFELYFDSGVRCAADVVKALCLGARGVGLGRLYYWAAACHGEEGIVQLVERLTFEVRRCMAQLGCRRLSELGVACLAKSEGGGFSRRLDDYGRPRL